MKQRLTEIAQQRVAETLTSGDFAIDATAGNGHDTAFLAQLVGINGQVFAFDVQPEAIAATQSRVADLGWKNVTLFQKSHAELEFVLPSDASGRVGAAMFNLGYLPGGDHAIVTESESTLDAINAALRIMRSGGVLTIVAYPDTPVEPAKPQQLPSISPTSIGTSIPSSGSTV